MSTKILSIRFGGAGELLAQASHLEHGALFVPPPDPPPEAMAEVQLWIEFGSRHVELPARVIQIIPGGNIAVAFSDTEAAKEALEPLLAEARTMKDDGGGETQSTWGRPQAPPADEGTLHDRIRKMSSREKMQLAAHGDRAARLILIKDTNKIVHTFVIQNPRITLDEVRYIAGFKQCNPDVLKTIAQNREWTQNPRVVSALVRNPKTPGQIAVRLLDKLPVSELRALAKSPSVPRAVCQAARRKVTG